MKHHYIISVQDSINDYHEVQGGYFDGTKSQAIKHFRSHSPWKKYFGDTRYQITMQANPYILQWTVRGITTTGERNE